MRTKQVKHYPDLINSCGKAMHSVKGRCRCGQASFLFETHHAISSLSPRKCDCHFCTPRGIQYLSDPEGRLRLNFDGADKILKQGSQQAAFHTCANCGDVLAVSCEFEYGTRGAANATLVSATSDSGSDFAPAVTISPKSLTAEEKYKRWQTLWTPLTIFD